MRIVLLSWWKPCNAVRSRIACTYDRLQHVTYYANQVTYLLPSKLTSSIILVQ